MRCRKPDGDFELMADEKVRAALAESIGLRALPRLEASFDVSRHGREGLHVVGRVSATVGQNCVVTLEPIDSEIDEAVDLVFEPAPVRGGLHTKTAAAARLPPTTHQNRWLAALSILAWSRPSF